MASTNFRRIWLHGKPEAGLEHIKPGIFSAQDVLVGWSSAGREHAAFPNGALVPALYAAMHGAFDLLLIEETGPGGLTPPRISDLARIFAGYGVTVKSYSSFGNSNS